MLSGKNILLCHIAAFIMTVLFVNAHAAEPFPVKASSVRQAAVLTNEDFFHAFIKSIDAAQHEILMSVFSFKTGVHPNSYPDRIAGHLEKAVKRGVKVTVVLETTRNSADTLDLQNRKTGRFLEKKGVRVFYDSPYKSTHTKLIVIDQRLIFLGSHNFTQSALKHNNEISVLLDSPALAVGVRNYILNIMKEGK